MDGDIFGEWLSANHGAARASEEEPPRPDNRREMRRLNRIENPKDFAKALDALKLKW